ncbi:MAG: hypothetical protein ACMUHY_09680, partial [Thermoplasmatota archaeon]
VGRTRLELERTGTIIRGNMLNPGAMGFNIGSHFTIHYGKGSAAHSVSEFEARLRERYLPIFWISSREMATFVYFFRDLSGFKRFNSELFNMQEAVVISNLRSVPFSLRSSAMVRHHYLGEGGGRGFSLHNHHDRIASMPPGGAS